MEQQKQPLAITYLRPAESWAKVAKTYTAPSRDAKQSDYNLGSIFNWDHQEYQTLQEFAVDMRSREREFAIYGPPAPGLDLLSDVAARRTVNFPYPEQQRLHIFDIDGWDIPEATLASIKPRLTDQNSMHRLINDMLRIAGFEQLARASKVVVLTSSCWTLDKLYCHIYVAFSEPIRVEALRNFATALSKVKQQKVIDPAIYKAVQPQFFGAPTCLGFADPLDGCRVTYYQGAQDEVDTAEFQVMVNTTLQNAEWNPNTAKTDLPPIGVNWLQTIQDHLG